ncbi:hypothetical protein GH865_11905 [Rhodocyclus tenuis]|uniref:hypothetical protein n=1 Tax=Rhodocyclus gracilis TaxID=2929842 RepID=UPI001298A8AC|nr:hypothetical protein [Rhodocyclus gracilis]MRD73945.1 hypothetical protein [Rhodocyclus gracilis]
MHAAVMQGACQDRKTVAPCGFGVVEIRDDFPGQRRYFQGFGGASKSGVGGAVWGRAMDFFALFRPRDSPFRTKWKEVAGFIRK